MMKLTNKGMRRMMTGNLPIIFEENGRQGIRMPNGTLALPPVYQAIRETESACLYIIKSDTGQGILYIDDQGHTLTVLEPEYDSLCHFDGNQYIVTQDGKYGLWNGTFAIPCRYEYIIPTLMNTCLLLKENGKYGVWKDTLCVPCIFDEITEGEYEEEVQVFEDFKQTFTKEYLLLRQGTRYGMWSKESGYVKPVYDEILPIEGSTAFRVKRDGQWNRLHADGHIE